MFSKKSKVKEEKKDGTSQPDVVIINKILAVINKYMNDKLHFAKGAQEMKFRFIQGVINDIYHFVGKVQPTITHPDNQGNPVEGSLLCDFNLKRKEGILQYYPELTMSSDPLTAPDKFKQLIQELKGRIQSYKEGSKRSKIKRNLLSTLNDKDVNTALAELEKIRQDRLTTATKVEKNDSQLILQDETNSTLSGDNIFAILPQDLLKEEIISRVENFNSLARTCKFFNKIINDENLITKRVLKNSELTTTQLDELKKTNSVREIYMAMKHKIIHTTLPVMYDKQQLSMHHNDPLRILNSNYNRVDFFKNNLIRNCRIFSNHDYESTIDGFGRANLLVGGKIFVIGFDFTTDELNEMRKNPTDTSHSLRDPRSHICGIYEVQGVVMHQEGFNKMILNRRLIRVNFDPHKQLFLEEKTSPDLEEKISAIKLAHAAKLKEEKIKLAEKYFNTSLKNVVNIDHALKLYDQEQKNNRKLEATDEEVATMQAKNNF